MTKYYAASTKGFYSDDVHTSWPSDAIQITDEEWQSLLDGQANGQVIQPDADGKPVLVTPPPAPEPEPLTVEQKLASVGLTIADLKAALENK